jgi:hypothetical protein
LGLTDIEQKGVELVEQALQFEARFRGVDVDQLCACQLPQASGGKLTECQSNAAASGIDGWCSIDPQQGIGSPEFVSDCRVGQPRTLRMLGALAELRESDLFLTCYE